MGSAKGFSFINKKKFSIVSKDLPPFIKQGSKSRSLANIFTINNRFNDTDSMK